MGNVVKQAASTFAPLGITGTVAGLFGGGGGAGPELDKSVFNRQKEVDERTKQARQASQDLITKLQDQAAGKTPSLAEAQLKAAQDRNLSQVMAAAAAQRGRNPAAAQRQILNAQGAAGRDLAQQSAQARLQEQLAAQNLLANQSLGQQSADLQQVMSPAGLAAQGETARFGADVARQQAIQQQQSQILGSILQSGATIGAAGMKSDEQAKKSISSAKKEAQSFLDALSARQYEYKDASEPGTAPGTRYGIMAQDLEKSKMGKSLVRDTEHGKMVDTVQGFGAVLAAQAELNKRLKKLEGK